MNIKILGSGCPNCKALEARVREVLAERQATASWSGGPRPSIAILAAWPGPRT